LSEVNKSYGAVVVATDISPVSGAGPWKNLEKRFETSYKRFSKHTEFLKGITPACRYRLINRGCRVPFNFHAQIRFIYNRECLG